MKSLVFNCEVWVNEDGDEVSCFVKDCIDKLKRQRLINSSCKLIHSFTAATFEEAMSIYYLRMGYESYKPQGEPKLCPQNCGSFYYPEGSSQCPYCGLV